MKPAENISPPVDLLESQRNLGYSLEQAVSDLIDNSITAGAKEISYECLFNDGEPVFLLKDSGRGMSMKDNEIVECFKLGGSVRKERVRHDLGRFGCGLKTASLSQARCLIVVSKAKGFELIARALDLDWMTEHNRGWQLREVDHTEITDCLDWFETRESGTVIKWLNWDKSINDETQFYNAIDKVNNYVSVCFHRYMTNHKIKISCGLINLKPISPIPSESTRKEGPIKEMTIQGSATMETWLLSNSDQVNEDGAFNAYGLFNGLSNQQGIYIYREDRLLTPFGGWHGYIRSSNSSKLARVVISYENNNDSSWDLDIKKTQSTIPKSFEKSIVDLIKTAKVKSSKKRQEKERKTTKDLIRSQRLWNINKNSDTNAVSVLINRNNSTVGLIKDRYNMTVKDLEFFLQAIENSLPIDRMIERYTEDKECYDGNVLSDNFLSILNEVAEKQIKDVMAALDLSRKEAEYKVYSEEPFCHIPSIKRSKAR